MDSSSRNGNENPKVRMVKCPLCKKPAVFGSENPDRPFCSERCRLIDLGAWASESYAVPSEEKISIQDPENLSDSDEEV